MLTIKKKVFLSGPFCNQDKEWLEYRFAAAQQLLEAKGFEVFNHVDTSWQCISDSGIDIEDCPHCFENRMIALIGSEEVHMMQGWQLCKEATRDRNVALTLEIPVFYL